MSSIAIRPNEPVDEETQAILNERLKTIDYDAKSARPWREVMAESQAKLKQSPAGFGSGSCRGESVGSTCGAEISSALDSSRWDPKQAAAILKAEL